MVAIRSAAALLLSLAILGAGCGNGTPCPTLCTGDKPLCDATKKTCVGCLGDTNCPVGQVCMDGACTAGCNPNKPECGADKICEVTKGRCVRCLPADDKCPDGQVCVPTADAYDCVAGCKTKADCKGQGPGYDCCDHACVALATSDANCGACGKKCDNGKSCCAAACVDKAADVANCGACGMACMVPNAAPACAMSTCGVASCNKGFADCDKAAMNGCEITTDTDVKNCGACSAACPPPDHGTAGCAAGACTVAACDMGFADCDKAVMNGCEVSLGTDVANCGGCGMACAAPMNGAAACAAGACAIGACDQGFADCDKMLVNGCEVSTVTDVNNCGGCGMACGAVKNGTPGCMGSTCVIGACDMGFADCDRTAGTGCEVSTATDVNNCGACGQMCPAPPNGAAACVSAACGLGACNMGFADCNKVVKDGCEVNLANNPANCGACGNMCNVANGIAGCANNACTVASCNMGFADCNAKPGDGCEVNTGKDVNNCGKCGAGCGAPANGSATCVASACALETCNMGFADCNKVFGDGCEVNTTNDAKNCGGCGTTCTAANGVGGCTNSACSVASCNAGFADCDKMVANGCEVNTTSDAKNCGACGNVCQSGICTNGACTARTIPNFTGQLGPDYSGTGWTQCLGILDKANVDDLPATNWGAACIGNGFNQLRLVCGASANSVRYIDVKRNVLSTKLNAYPETGLITAAGGFTLPGNDIYADTNDPNNNRSWWVTGNGCGESNLNITINNICTWDVANCFGQNLVGDRYFYVYVHP